MLCKFHHLSSYNLRPLTHSLETGAICLNSTSDSGASFFVLMHDIRSRALTAVGPEAWQLIMMLQVVHWHDKTGSRIWCQIYGTNFWSVCREPNVRIEICIRILLLHIMLLLLQGGPKKTGPFLKVCNSCI